LDIGRWRVCVRACVIVGELTGKLGTFTSLLGI